MRRHHRYLFFALAALVLAACGNPSQNDSKTTADDEKKTAPQAPQKAESDFRTLPAKASAPFRVDYRIIGTPIVGSPLTVDLRVESNMGSVPVQLDYRIEDLSSMLLHEAQPKSIVASPAANESFVSERVTLIPQREGRLYFNVSASVETAEGSTSSVISIPIHVGAVSTAPVEHGQIEVDENDEPVRVLSPE